MAHYRKPLAAAVALNSAIFLVEAFAGFQANSLSLIMDSVHNLSDELALVFLYLAFVLPLGLSRNLLRSANVFNSIGIVVLSALKTLADRRRLREDRKSTRLNSSHLVISYAVFCLKKKKNIMSQ